MTTAEETVREAFEGPNAIRSAHVHEVRHDTEDLSWASSLELIANAHAADSNAERINWHVVAEMKYKECREEFIANKSAERKVIRQLLNGLALIAQPIVELRR